MAKQQLTLLMDCAEEEHTLQDENRASKRGKGKGGKIRKVTIFRPIFCFVHGDVTDAKAFKSNFICDQFFDSKDNAYKYMLDVLTVMTKPPEAMTKNYELEKAQEKNEIKLT